MIDEAKIRGILGSISYKEGWRLRLSREERSAYMMWEFPATCVKTKSQGIVTSRKWRISEYMTESEIVGTALLAALTAEEHEAREHFRYKDVRVYNPHVDIKQLLAVGEIEDTRIDL